MAKNHRGKGNFLERRHQERQKNTVVYGDRDRAFSPPSPYEMKHRRRYYGTEKRGFDPSVLEEMRAFSRERFAEQKVIEQSASDHGGFYGGYADSLSGYLYLMAGVPEDLVRLRTDNVTVSSLTDYYTKQGGVVSFEYVRELDRLLAKDGYLLCLVYPDNALRYLSINYKDAYDKIMEICRHAGVRIMQRHDSNDTAEIVLNLSTVKIVNGVNLASFMAFLAERMARSPFIVKLQMADRLVNPQPRKVKLDD